MKIRRRLGVLALAVSGLLAAGVLLSAPAFAWDTELKDVSASCPPGSSQPRVDIALKLFDSGHSGHVEVAFKIGQDGELQAVPDDELFNQAGEAGGSFGKDDQVLKLHFFVENPSEDTSIAVKTTTFFDDLPESEQPPESQGMADLKKCQQEESSSSSSSSSTSTTVAPSSTVAPPTTIGLPTTTVSAAKLPRTGSSTLPVLIAAIVMLVGGGAALFATRVRGRHAK